MKTIYDQAGVILVFLVSVLLFQSVLGKKATMMGLTLILIGQVLFNPELINKLKLQPTPLGEPDVRAGIRTNNPIYNGGGVILL